MFMKKNKEQKPVRWKAFLWMLIFPIQLALDVALFYGGLYLDGQAFKPGPDTIGHGVPIFTGLGLGIALIMTEVSLVLAIILPIISFIIRSRRLKKWNEKHHSDANA